MESLITKRQINIFAGVALLLLVPLIATLLSDEVNWKLFDFIIAGLLLSAAALTMEWLSRKVKNGTYRWLWISLVGLVLLLIWAELAVGIFGSPLAGS